MRQLARSLAVAAGVVGLVAALAGLVREVALAADPHLAWSAPSWWRDLLDGGGPTVVAAVVAAALTILLLVLAARQFAGGDDAPVSRVPAGEGAAVSVEALQRLVARRLADAVPGVEPVAVELRKVDGGWRARVTADVVPRDVAGLQVSAAQLADAEVRQAAGEGVGSLELRVRRFVGAAR